MTRRINYRAIGFRSLAVFVAVFLFTIMFNVRRQDMVNVEAASLEKFNPGYIISDYQMGRYNSMTEAEIQEFLTSKNSCNNKDEALYKSLSANNPTISWHFKEGHFVCLSEELFGDGEVIGKGETAAHIIWQAAQDYKINPQVLLVLLQKETGLITDKIPNNFDYRKATGYGCPDTAPCSEKYYGFKNQIRKAAALFSEVLSGGWTNYPLGENYIQYNPAASCGGTTVNIKNLATSALYRYTPYQPNAAALAAGYGTAACGAYGNRNFYLYFEDWFGGILNEEKKTAEIIKGGIYQIESKAFSGKVVDIKGGVYEGMTNGKTLVFNNKIKMNQIANQVFEMKYNSKNGYYNIVNPTTGLVLDVEGISDADSTPVIVWKQNSGCNQDWLIERDADGYYEIISRCSNKRLTVNNLGDLVISSKNNNKNQKWNLIPAQVEKNIVRKGTYQITAGGLAFDVKGGVSKETKNGTIIGYNQKNKDSSSIDNQLFVLDFDNDKQQYIIKNKFTGLVLKNDNGLKIGADTKTCASRWILYRKANEKFEIVSACGGAIGTPEASKNLTVVDSDGAEWSFVIYGDDNVSEIKDGVRYQLMADKDAIDIYGGVIKNMTIGDLIEYPAKQSEKDNQAFVFKYSIETDDYLIYNPITGLYLDVAEARTKDDSPVIVFSYNGNCNQRWKVTKKAAGFEIASVCSDKTLGASKTLKMGDYPRLVIGGKATQWKLTEIK